MHSSPWQCEMDLPSIIMYSTWFVQAIFVFKKPHSSSGRSLQKLPHFHQPWYKAYKQAWDTLERQVKVMFMHLVLGQFLYNGCLALQEMYTDVFAKLLNEVALFLKNDTNPSDSIMVEIPTALILTGL